LFLYDTIKASQLPADGVASHVVQKAGCSRRRRPSRLLGEAARRPASHRRSLCRSSASKYALQILTKYEKAGWTMTARHGLVAPTVVGLQGVPGKLLSR